MGLRTKISLGLGGLLAIVLAVTALSSFVFSKYSGATQDMLRHDFDSVLACQRMQEALELSNAAVEKSLLGSTADITDELSQRMGDFDRALALQQASINLPGEEKLTADIVSDLNRYRTCCVDIMNTSESLVHRNTAYASELTPAAQTLRIDLQKLYRINRASGLSTQGEALTLARNSRSALHIMAGLATLLAVVFAVLISRVVVRPLRQLTSTVQQIRQGNLDTSVAVYSGDELGQLALAFNEMTVQLRELRRVDRERIARSERTTQLAIDSLPDPVLVVSPTGRLELTNHAAREWFGFEPGSDVSQLNATWLSELLARKRPATSAELIDYEAVIRTHRDGNEQFLLPRAVEILDEQRRVIGVTVVLNDVTGLRRLDQMKSGLLALVSHELKTPLTSVRMALHLLANTRIDSLTPELKELLSAARDDSDRLSRIVENLLDMGRIESGRVLMDMKSVEVHDLLRQGAEPLKRAFLEQGVALKLEVAPGLPRVKADCTRVGYALSNLLGNALRYTPAGGVVAVSASARGEHVVVSVSDSGPGISPRFQHRIFEKFFRVPGQPSDGGAGLGLAICKDIVEAHGGRVGVDSEPGRGSTFYFTLRTDASAAV